MRGRAGRPGSWPPSRGSGVRARRSLEGSGIPRLSQGYSLGRMRVLGLADQPPPMVPALMERRRRVDAVVCLGAPDRAWIQSLPELHIPRVGVHGNHDPPDLLRELEIEDLHTRRTRL